MTNKELHQIEVRHLQAQPDEGGTLSFNAMLESFKDVPALCVELRRLQGDRDEWMGSAAGYGSDAEMARHDRDEARKLAKHLLGLWCGGDTICREGFEATYLWLKED